MTDRNVEHVRKTMADYDRNRSREIELMKEFTRRVNEDLDRLTPTRRTNAINTA